MSYLLIKVKHLVKSVDNYDWISKNDLFVIIRYGTECRRTNVKWDDNDSQWNETFLLNLNTEIEELQVELYDENVWSSIKNISKTIIEIKHKSVAPVTAGVILLEMGNPLYEFYETIKDGDKIIREQTQLIKDQKTRLDTLEEKINEIIKILSV